MTMMRLICWCMIGFSMGVLAYELGWRKCLKVAPYFFVGWLAITIWTNVWPLFPGWRGWFKMGIPLNVWEFAPLSIGLFGAWIASKVRIKLAGILGLVMLGLFAAEVATIACNEERVAHIRAVCENSPRIRAAIKNEESKKDIINGRPFYNAMCLGIALLGAGLVLVMFKLKDEPTKVFVTIIGLWMGGRALGSILGGIGITPKVEVAVPFLSGGGSLIVATLWSLGLVAIGLKENLYKERMSSGENVDGYSRISAEAAYSRLEFLG